MPEYDVFLVNKYLYLSSMCLTGQGDEAKTK